MMPIIEIENLLSASQKRVNTPEWDSLDSLENSVEDSAEANPHSRNNDIPDHLKTVVANALAYVRQAQQQICEREMRIRFLETASTTDELTGLWNKRGFVLMAEKMFSLARHYDQKGLIALIEVEPSNDHEEPQDRMVMDRIVREAGSILLSRFPDPCVVARVDSAIFGIVLPTSHVEECRLWLVDEIKQALREATVGYHDSLSFRVNLGTSDYHATSILEDVLESAEMHMEQSRLYQIQFEQEMSLEGLLKRRCASVESTHYAV